MYCKLWIIVIQSIASVLLNKIVDTNIFDITGQRMTIGGFLFITANNVQAAAVIVRVYQSIGLSASVAWMLNTTSFLFLEAKVMKAFSESWQVFHRGANSRRNMLDVPYNVFILTQGRPEQYVDFSAQLHWHWGCCCSFRDSFICISLSDLVYLASTLVQHCTA